MAEIPSDIASSAAQAGFRARETARERDGQRAGQASAADRQIRAVDKADTTVETGDDDTQVFSDAEGAGSQGRDFEDSAEQEAESADDGIRRDDDGQLHLDLEA